MEKLKVFWRKCSTNVPGFKRTLEVVIVVGKKKLTVIWVQDRFCKGSKGEQLCQHGIHGNQNRHSQLLTKGRGHRRGTHRWGEPAKKGKKTQAELDIIEKTERGKILNDFKNTLLQIPTIRVLTHTNNTSLIYLWIWRYNW